AWVSARRRGAPGEGAIILQERLVAITLQSVTGYGQDVSVQEPGVEQLADQVAHTTRGVEVIHVRPAVWIDPRQQRHARGQVAEVIPGELDAGRSGDRHQVNRVVGRAAGRQQADHRVGEGAPVNPVATR